MRFCGQGSSYFNNFLNFLCGKISADAIGTTQQIIDKSVILWSLIPMEMYHHICNSYARNVSLSINIIKLYLLAQKKSIAAFSVVCVLCRLVSLKGVFEGKSLDWIESKDIVRVARMRILVTAYNCIIDHQYFYLAMERRSTV